MSYDNGRVTTYVFAGHDFGTGTDIVDTIAVPLDGPSTVTPGQGRGGKVVGVTVYNVTEVFAGSTLDAGVQVGDGATDGLYYDTGLALDESVDLLESVWLADTGSKVDIPAGETTLTITFQSATGTPTGIANVALEVQWYGPVS